MEPLKNLDTDDKHQTATLNGVFTVIIIASYALVCLVAIYGIDGLISYASTLAQSAAQIQEAIRFFADIVIDLSLLITIGCIVTTMITMLVVYGAGQILNGFCDV